MELEEEALKDLGRFHDMREKSSSLVRESAYHYQLQSSVREEQGSWHFCFSQADIEVHIQRVSLTPEWLAFQSFGEGE